MYFTSSLLVKSASADDGTVKLCVLGDELEVQDFLKEILINSNLSHHIIDHHEEQLPTEGFDDINGFSII